MSPRPPARPPHAAAGARGDNPRARADAGRGPSTRVVGLGAARAVLRARPQDVLNIAHARTARHELKDLLREAARLRIAYREVESDELERIADTVHHEGICLLVKQRPEPGIAELLRAIEREGVLLALDRVENPHNVGALLRSAAYFGVRGLLLVSPRERALTPAVVRVAEGGAEAVPTCLVPNLAVPLAQLRKEGVAIIGADAHRGEAIGSFRFPARSVIVMGSERHGLAQDVAQCCTDLIHIPGTDAVESLNVSVAAGILLAFATRRGKRAS
jgi:TrmH RNA methyltransferase